MRYEALVLRELKSTTYQWLQVSHMEWLTFAQQALDNGFYSVTAKVLSCYVMFKVEKEKSAHHVNEYVDNDIICLHYKDSECFVNQIDYTLECFSDIPVAYS